MALAMSTQLFPDLEGDFDLASESIGGQLDAGSIQGAIAEQQSRRNHWRLRWQHVQYGVFQGEPVCLMVIDGRFHAEDPKRHRFTWLRISVEFAGSGLVGEPFEVKRYSPERAYGISVAEQRASSWALRSVQHRFWSRTLWGTYADGTAKLQDLGHYPRRSAHG
jgi:hypothetical protein